MDEQVGRSETTPAERPQRVTLRETPVTARPRSRLGLLLGAILVVALGIALWLHPWSGGGGRVAPAPPPQPVGEATAVTGNVPVTLNALGTVTPLATVTVRTQIAGQLQQIGFKEGQMVKAGDFLAQVDPRPYQVALEQAQGTLAHDTALLAQARADLARFQTLNRQDSISRQQVEDQAFLARQYEGSIATDQAQVDSAKLNLAYTHIVAPVSGRVGLRQVDAGNYVQVTDTNGIVVITQLQPISVIFTLPEDNLPQIMARLHAGATLPVIAFDRSNTTKLADGTLETVDNVIDTTTGTVKFRATFPNADNELFPNQFVNAQLLVDTVTGVTVVPSAAIQRGAPGTYVYLINADDTVSVRKVTLGPSDGQRTAITAGLAAGDKVVVDGADRLRDGEKVTVPPPAGTAPAAAAAAAKGRRAKAAQ